MEREGGVIWAALTVVIVAGLLSCLSFCTRIPHRDLFYIVDDSITAGAFVAIAIQAWATLKQTRALTEQVQLTRRTLYMYYKEPARQVYCWLHDISKKINAVYKDITNLTPSDTQQLELIIQELKELTTKADKALPDLLERITALPNFNLNPREAKLMSNTADIPSHLEQAAAQLPHNPQQAHRHLAYALAKAATPTMILEENYALTPKDCLTQRGVRIIRDH